MTRIERKAPVLCSPTIRKETSFKLCVFVCDEERTHAPQFAPEITPNRTKWCFATRLSVSDKVPAEGTPAHFPQNASMLLRVSRYCYYNGK